MARDYERLHRRYLLDAAPDFVIDGGAIAFGKAFEVLEAPDTYARAPDDVIESARSLLEMDVVDTVAKMVHDTVTVRIGCCAVPVFALEDGGRGRTLFTFKCVYDNCPAFLDVRVFSAADRVKWVLMGVSHSHDFTFFPQRTPRGIFPDDVVVSIRDMAQKNIPCAAVKMQLGVLCSDDAFQNVLRETRREMKGDQARALRDAAAGSRRWASEVHLTANNVFLEAFFVNAVILTKRLDVPFVFVDDTACSNMFHLPVISVLCRDAADQTHALCWGLLKNRTTASFRRFFAFLFRHVPTIRTFVCDSHAAQSRAIRDVFGDAVDIFHCCVHVGRNIRNNAGQSSALSASFWEMRFSRTPEAEARFLETLQRVHTAKHSLFTTHLLRQVDAFLPSRVDAALKKSKFPELRTARTLDLSLFRAGCERHRKALAILQRMAMVDDVEYDIYTVDNTNVIESYFSVVKKRLRGTPQTLLDVFNAVDFTEATVLARNNCFAARPHPQLHDCLATIVSPGGPRRPFSGRGERADRADRLRMCRDTERRGPRRQLDLHCLSLHPERGAS